VGHNVSGRHRNPGDGPLSEEEFLAAPVAAARAVASDGATRPGPEWPPDPTAPWPQFNSPPTVMYREHPSAPLPQVPGPRPYDLRRARADVGEAATILRAAQQEAALIVRAAEREAAAIRRDAGREVAEQREAVMTMSADLGQLAAYVLDSLDKHAPWQARPQVPDGEELAQPPDAGPASRQVAAMRVMSVVFLVLLLVAVAGGATEIGMHGFEFFVFRSAGTGATDGSGLHENQGPGQLDAPATRGERSQP
jgi:hypothetical protein